MSREQRMKALRDWLTAAVLVAMLALPMLYFFDEYYDLNDDVLIKDILSGTYTGEPSGYNIQMLYPVSFLFCLFYKILPKIGGVTIPWYGVITVTLHLGCCLLILKRTMSFGKNFAKKIALIILEVLFAGALILYQFVYIQYSVTSAFLSATAIFLYSTTKDEVSPSAFTRKNIPSIILLTLSFYIRTEMMLLLCPLMAAAGVIKWFHGSRKMGVSPVSIGSLIKYLVTPLCVGVLMIVGMVIHSFAYNSEEWTLFDRFFDARTELYDFQNAKLPSYSENELFYSEIDITGSELPLFDNYNFSLDEKIDADVVEAIVDYNRDSLGESYFKYDFIDGLKEYLYRITHKVDAPYIYVVVLLYILIIVTAMLQLDTGIFWKVVLLAAARTVSWMYLIMRGRIVDRVTVPLYITEILILTAILLTETYEFAQDTEELKKPYKKIWPCIMAILLLVLIIVPDSRVFDRIEREQERRIEVNKPYECLKEFFAKHPENYYLIDVYSSVPYSDMVFRNVDNTYRNFDICGGWASKSPVYREKLSGAGISDIQSDLINMNNLYFVTAIDRDMDWLVAYYKGKGFDVRLRNAGCFKVDGEKKFMIYKIYLHQSHNFRNANIMEAGMMINF